MDKGIRIIQINSPETKNEWIRKTTHPLQSWEWGEFRASMGIQVIRLGRYDDQELAEVVQITFHPIPHTSFTVGYIPKSALPSDVMLAEIKKVGKEHKAVFIQLEPDATIGTLSHDISPLLKPSHHPLFTKYTFVLDLTKSEEELLKNMQSKSRYNIRVATKHGVIVKEDNSDMAFEAYIALSKETTDRQEFYAHNRLYHTRMWETLKKDNIARLFTATYNGMPLAAWIIFCWNKTIYYPYGASSTQERQVMAPNLLLWEIARWGKTHGYTAFDLWGAMGPTPDQNDPWYGFHRFKSGYSPTLVEFIGSYDLVINPLLYKIYILLDVLRWKYLKLVKRTH